MAVISPVTTSCPITLAPAPIQLHNFTKVEAVAAPYPNTTAGPPRMTSKEWIVPPRPKPGRKPAIDTPPTKRKAQNRAAQRAFRERRAARVGELEEQLEETREEQQKKVTVLRDTVTKLEIDVQYFCTELQTWKTKCEVAERMIERERLEKEAALSELEYLRKGFKTKGTDAVPLPPRRKVQKQARDVLLAQTSMSIPLDLPTTCNTCASAGRCECLEAATIMESNGCGNCTPTSHCACLEASVDLSDALISVKRSHSPSNTLVEKRPRNMSGTVTPIEIDFTTQQTVRTTPGNELQAPSGRSVLQQGPCGFCEDGSYCLCADSQGIDNANNNYENRLPPLLHEATPPPSDTENESSHHKITPLHPAVIHREVTTQTSKPNDPCVNGPGTCKQCVSDPNSASFCRSLAVIGASTSSLPSPKVNLQGSCCGDLLGGKCCRNSSTGSSEIHGTTSSLNVAETYRTLSTHKHFDEARDDMNTWLGKLDATTAIGQQQHAGRAPVEVEAASVMGVLKYFDRRFGRG